MSDALVKVRFAKAQEQATLLLEAAEKSKDHDAAAVRTVLGGFLVPESLAKSAGVEYEKNGNTDSEPDSERRPTKKAAAKKSAAKKS